MFRTLGVIVGALAALVVSGCNDETPTSPTTPTAPVTITETFVGTVTRNGGVTHPFATQASGTVTATLSVLGAAEGTRIGLALGTYNGSTCSLVITKDDTVALQGITGAVSAIGSLCVRIYDVGALTASADYEIQVVHP